MSISDIFNGSNNDLEATSADSIRPIWTLGKGIEEDKKVLAWLNSAHRIELKRHNEYRTNALKNIALFEGAHYSAASSNRAGYAESSTQGLAYRSPKVSKLVVNYIFQGVQQRANLITRNRPAVSISPVNTEYSDRISAKLVKYLSDYEIYQTDFDRIIGEIVRAAYKMGEAYYHPYWDPNRGPPLPGTSEEDGEDQKPSLPVTDEEGNPVLGEDGKQLEIQKPVNAGDVAAKCLTPLNTLVQSGVDFDKVTYFIEEEWRDIDELKAEYGSKADAISLERDIELNDAKIMPPPDPNCVLVRKFWHKSTPFLGKGRFIMATNEAVLENSPLPKGMKNLPLVRLTDIDVSSKKRGLSLISQAKGLNFTLNDFASIMRRNAILAGHPKWLVPSGSLVKKEALGNDITQIDFKGPQKPEMIGPPPLSSEITALRREFREEIMTIFRVSENMQGKTQPNVRSALAMQMVDEQDEQRASGDVSKYQALVRTSVERMLEVCGAHFKKSDPRLIPIVGKDQRYLLKEFDPIHLRKGFDVRIGNSSGMPQTKSAKIEALIQLRHEFGPTVVRDEQVVDMLEFGDSERYFDQAAVASRAAEAENEALMGGEDIAPPVAFENTIVHWTVHMRDVQNRGFKLTTPPDVQEMTVAHLMATEMLMLQAARRNPLFALELVKLPMFPAFFELSMVDRIVLDRARTGNPLSLLELQVIEETGQIPPMPMGAGAPPAGGMHNTDQNANKDAMQGASEPSVSPTGLPEDMAGAGAGPQPGDEET